MVKRSAVPFLRYGLLVACLFVIFSLSPAIGADIGFSGVSAGSGCGPTGTLISIPLTLSGVKDPIGNMDIVIAFDPSLLRATGVEKGDLTTDALFDYNIETSRVRLAIASNEGLKDTGTLAYLVFQVTGTSGTSPIHIEDLSTNHAETFQSLSIAYRDGSMTVLTGIRFVTEGSTQVVIVDPTQIGPDSRIEGSTIICSQCGLVFTIGTAGLSSKDGVLQGVVQSVSLASTPVSADLSFGRVEGRFEITLPRYPPDGYFSMTLAETVDPGIRDAFEQAAGKRGRSINAIAFLAHIKHGYGKTGLAVGHFTVPNSLIESLGGMENIWFGHVSNYLAPELLKAEKESGPDQNGMVTIRVYSPEGLSIFGMASAKVKSIANPLPPGAAPTPPGETGLTIFGNIIITAVTFSTGNLLIGAGFISLLVSGALVGVWYTHKKRGG